MYHLHQHIPAVSKPSAPDMPDMMHLVFRTSLFLELLLYMQYLAGQIQVLIT